MKKELNMNTKFKTQKNKQEIENQIKHECIKHLNKNINPKYGKRVEDDGKSKSWQI